MWHDLSIIFNEIVLYNKFWFEPQHYFEDFYRPIFASIYTLGVAIEMQLSQQVLLMTFFIIEIIEGIILSILMAYYV